MTKEELKELHDAINRVHKPKHLLYIEGDNFKCKYKNGKFIWTVSACEEYVLDAESVLHYIGNGEHVKYFSYDYVS